MARYSFLVHTTKYVIPILLFSLRVFLVCTDIYTYQAARFGSRARVYTAHFPRVFGVDILREMAALWPDAHFTSSKHRLRGSNHDLHLGFLFVHYVMEKSREEMLRSYFLYRVDSDMDGAWTLEERSDAINKLSRAQKESARRVIDEGGRQTTYSWSSEFGYPFIKKSIQTHDYWVIKGRPAGVSCDLPVEECFGEEWLTKRSGIPAEMKFFEGRDLACGDCILSRLATLGDWTQREILPPANSTVYKPVMDRLSRYRYVLGDSNLEFVFYSGNSQALGIIKKTKPAMYCINNDALTAENLLRSNIEQFLSSQFPVKSPCER